MCVDVYIYTIAYTFMINRMDKTRAKKSPENKGNYFCYIVYVLVIIIKEELRKTIQ